MKISSIFILIFGLLLHPCAQIIIEEEDHQTDTVSLFPTTESEEEQSPALAMAASIFLPGLGHRYLQRPVASFLYSTADILALFGAAVCYGQSRKLSSDAQAYAWTYAGASGEANDDQYWRNIGNHMDYNQYNTYQDLNRTPENRYEDPDSWWQWPDSSFKDEYNDLRKYSRRFQVASSFFLGALVLNRVVSFVDARTSIRRNRKAIISTVQFIPHYSFHNYNHEYGMALSTRF